jgi:hypothetical protein
VGAGARLITDDVAAVELEPTPRLLGGVPHVRLWRDSALVLATSGSELQWGAAKVMVEPVDTGRIAGVPVPIAALYILTPVRADTGIPAAARDAVTSVAAALQVLPHARLAPLLGRSEAGALLDGVARLTRVVPVHVLRVVRDFERIAEVVEQLLAWHGGSVAREARSGDAP